MNETHSIFEADLFQQLYGLSGKYPLLDEFFVFSAEFLMWGIVLVVVGMLIYAISQGWKQRALVLITSLFSGVVAWFVAMWAKTLFDTARPFADQAVVPLIDIQSSSAAFPSAHAAAVAAAGIVLLRFNKLFGLIVLALSLVVGVSRVAVGVHWPVDIAGGVVGGMVIGWILCRVLCSRRNKS